LVGKGVCVLKDKFAYIGLYGFEDEPFYLAIFVCDRFFIMEVCRQYRK